MIIIMNYFLFLSHLLVVGGGDGGDFIQLIEDLLFAVLEDHQALIGQ